MEVEAAVNRLEALVEKVDSDLNYAIIRLANEFSETFEDELDSETNPVSLVKRLQKAKEEFKNLADEAKEVEAAQKKMTKVLCCAVTEPINRIHHIQEQAGMEPSQNGHKELSMFNEKCNKPDKENQPQVANNEETFKGGDAALSRSSKKEFLPVTEQEFMTVSDLVRGRSKLADINRVYEVLFGYFKTNPAGSLTPKDMTKMGLKISGATGGAKLKVLRTLKIVQIDKQGNVQLL